MSQLARLAELTGVPLNAALRGAELRGSQVNFSRPELSPCLARFTDREDPKYQEAVALVRSGSEQLARTPRADLPGFRLVSGDDIARQARLDALVQIEREMRQAMLCGDKCYEKKSAPP